MAGYRYALGDIVCLRIRSGAAQALPDAFEIMALLPPRDGVVQYGIRAENEANERVVSEGDIEPARDRAANSNVPAHLRNG